jgi:hypothetical protein
VLEPFEKCCFAKEAGVGMLRGVGVGIWEFVSLRVERARLEGWWDVAVKALVQDKEDLASTVLCTDGPASYQNLGHNP